MNSQKQINLYDLKAEIIEIANELDRRTSRLMAPRTADIETGERRADAYTALFNCVDQLKDIAYDIY